MTERSHAPQRAKSDTEIRAWASNWDAASKTLRTLFRWGGLVWVVYLMSPFAGKHTILQTLITLGGTAKIEVAPLTIIAPWVLVGLLLIVCAVLLVVVFGRKMLGRLGHSLVEFEQQEALGRSEETDDDAE